MNTLLHFCWCKKQANTDCVCSVCGLDWDVRPEFFYRSFDFFVVSTDIICPRPDIPNGYIVGGASEYKENEFLHYECNARYQRIETRLSKCTNLGIRAEWSPEPQCERMYQLTIFSAYSCPITDNPQGLMCSLTRFYYVDLK